VAVDLHTHSTESDGGESPAAVVAMAAAAGLHAVALTDHDTLSGIAEARASAERAGIPFVPGTELSVAWEGRPMHLLCYWIEPGPGPLQDRLAALRDGRDLRNAQIVAALEDLGLGITLEEVATEAGTGSAGRPHIAAVLLRHGVVGSIAEAFDRYLAAGRPAYRSRPRLEAAEAIALTRASGGVSVVAHPHTVADDRAGFEAAFESFAALGVDGVECHYVEYRPEQRSRLAEIADGLGLIATGGSDFHGRYKPGIAVASGRGDLVVPDSAYAALIAARPGD
jgi:predicted metal-dependent phosphoesterase TrpH